MIPLHENARGMAAALLAFSLLAGCLNDNDKEARRGSVVENEAGIGRLYNEDGTPAAEAVVGAFMLNFEPSTGMLLKAGADTQSYFTRTDAEGRYTFRSIPRGRYNIIGEKGGRFSYQDSVPIDDGLAPLPSDTLKDPGSLVGTVQLQPNHDPRTATVEVLGTQVYANVDSAGTFILEGLARGDYRIRVTTSISEYTALFAGIRIRTGKRDTLFPALNPVFTGLPVVVNLRAAYDTLRGEVSLAWSPVKYLQFEEYLVYRSAANSLESWETLIARTSDTLWVDPVFRGSGSLQTEDRPLEYRIRVRNKSQEIGLSYESAKIRAVSTYQVTTSFKVTALGARSGRIGIGDSVRFVVVYKNPTRFNRRVSWFVDEGENPVREFPDSSMTSQDTLAWAWTDLGAKQLVIAVEDDGESVWRCTTAVQVVLDPPAADAGKDTMVHIGDRMDLKGTAVQEFGSIVKWEWDIGNKGEFTRTGSGDTSFNLSSVPDSAFRCVLRVTDEDGSQDKDTIRLNISPWRVLERSGLAGSGANILAVGGMVFELGLDREGTAFLRGYDTTLKDWDTWPVPRYDGADDYESLPQNRMFAHAGSLYVPSVPDGILYVFDVSAKTWSREACPAGPALLPAQILGGRIYLLSKDSAFKASTRMNVLHEYDPMMKVWTGKAGISTPTNEGLYGQTLASVGGRIYAIGGFSGGPGSARPIDTPDAGVREYDPLLDRWSLKQNAPVAGQWVHCAVQDETVFLISAVGSFWRYLPASDTWVALPPVPVFTQQAGFAPFKGRLYFLGGDRGSLRNEVWEFDPVAIQWKQVASMTEKRRSPFLADMGNNLFVVGGASENTSAESFTRY